MSLPKAIKHKFEVLADKVATGDFDHIAGGFEAFYEELESLCEIVACAVEEGECPPSIAIP